MHKLNKKPLVSIITVSLNSDTYIKDALQSVLNQSYQNIEQIVIDGGSIDRTIEIIKSFEQQFAGRLRWISEQDQGMYEAMNKGIALAEGEIIGILNSDDYYEDDIVRLVVASIKGYDMLHGMMRYVDECGKRIKTHAHKKGLLRKFVSAPFNHPTMFVKKAVYEDLGAFDPQYRTAGDYEFMLRFCHSKYSDFYLNRVVTNFRTVGVTSAAAIVINPGEIKQILLRQGLPAPFAVLFVWFRFFRAELRNVVIAYPWLLRLIRKALRYNVEE